MTSSTEGKSGVQAVSWVLLAAVLVAAVLMVVRGRQKTAAAAKTDTDPLLLVPAGPRLLLSADVASLMKVAGRDLGPLGDKLLGLRETCGFEPLLALRRAVFAMPFGDGQATTEGSDFALIAETSIDAPQGVRCAELVIRKRGGAPAQTRLAGFTSVRDRNKPPGEMALRPDGTFVLSGGQYFREVMDTAAGTTKLDERSKLRTQLHRSLRDKLGPAQLKLTLLPEASSVLRGVLAIGLGLDVGADVALRGLVLCDSAPACSTARGVIEKAKADMAQEPGFAGLANVRVQQQNERLELVGRLPRQQLGPLLTQFVFP